ncbi:IS3 family transposase, partial [Paenibacillus popilliae]
GSSTFKRYFLLFYHTPSLCSIRVRLFHQTFKAESFYLTKHDTYEDVLKDVRNDVRYYNNYRYIGRLNGLSPNDIDELYNG